jgi:hypothetical protein
MGDDFLIDGEPLPPPQPVVSAGIAPLSVSPRLDPGVEEIIVTAPDGATRVYRPHDPAVAAELAWLRLPWWRRWFTRRPEETT